MFVSYNLAARILNRENRSMLRDYQPPFERTVCAWEANLIIQCSNKRIEVWEMNVGDYMPGDIVAMDDTFGAVADTATWMNLQTPDAEPIAMLLQIEDLLLQPRQLRILYPTIGIRPIIEQEVVELEAFSLLVMTDGDRRSFLAGEESSSWVVFRNLVEQHGWTLVESRLHGGGAGWSIRRTLDRADISPAMTMQELREGGLIVIYDTVAEFARLLAELDSKLYEHIMQPSRASGCYVATAVYGSYDCPEVWVLRRWRDSVLLSTAFGRGTVRAYYHVSPHLVRKIGHRHAFSALVRPILDAFVRRLRDSGVSEAAYVDADSQPGRRVQESDQRL